MTGLMRKHHPKDKATRYNEINEGTFYEDHIN